MVPLIETFVTVRTVPPATTENALGSGVAPARASLNSIVSVSAFAEAESTVGATVSGVPFRTVSGPKFAVSFCAGVAWSRSRSAVDDGCA